MPRAKSTSSAKNAKKTNTSKNKSGGRKVETDTVDDVEECDSENEDTNDEVIDGADQLPSVPTSVKSAKKVILAPEEIGTTTGWDKIQEFHVQHPRTGNKSLFLLNTAKEDKAGCFTYEVLTLQQETRSWFIDDSVLSDGNLYVTTPVDPLFFVLPVLAKSDKAKPFVDHLQESTIPRVVADVFINRISSQQLENIATKKGLDDIVAYVYSEAKTLAWLVKKVEKVAEFLSEKGISQSESSVSSNFVKDSSVVNELSKEDSLRYACDIVGEYIDEVLKKKLLEKLGLPVTQEKGGLKRKSVQELGDENTNKKSKTDDDGPVVPLEDYGSATPLQANKNTKVTAREKELQKAAKGSHSLLKFFSKGK